MATIYKCDRCGTTILDGNFFRFVAVTIGPWGLSNKEEKSNLDLCEKCKTQIMDEANTPIPEKG